MDTIYVATDSWALQGTAIVASVVSMIIGGFAVWLSVTFYRWSTSVSEKTNEASKDIESSVDRLEKLFDKLYSDTFSMMRDTVDDMRKHAWATEEDTDKKKSAGLSHEVEKKAEQRIAEMKVGVSQELNKLFKQQENTDAKIGSLKEHLTQVMEKVINESRKIDADALEATIRDHIIKRINKVKRIRGHVTAAEIVEKNMGDFNTKEIADELRKMKTDGVISWDGEKLFPYTALHLTKT